MAGLLCSAVGVSAQNTALLKQNGTLPSGTATSMVHQAGDFIGLGTDAPAGPLEVLDQRISPSSRPNVANIVITHDDGGLGYSATDCIASVGTDMWGNPISIPPPYHCLPDNALVLRAAQYSGGTLTGHAQLFTLARNGSVGIKHTPYSGSALTAKAGWIDIERLSSSSAGNVGIRMRGYTGTIHHTIGTDAGNNNRLTITPGVGSAASDVVSIVGGLETSKEVLINTGSVMDDALEVGGKSMLHGPVDAMHNLHVGGHTDVANGLDVGSALTVGQTITVAGDGYFKGTNKMGYLHVGYDFNTPTNTPYPGGWYHLIVWGDALVKRVKVAVPNTTAWSDYVFAEDYKLRPLAEVNDYIRENGHLPDVPSAEDVVKEGVDLQTMDATLLRKVEELTLYVLAQQKEIEALKKELRDRRK